MELFGFAMQTLWGACSCSQMLTTNESDLHFTLSSLMVSLWLPYATSIIGFLFTHIATVVGRKNL